MRERRIDVAEVSQNALERIGYGQSLADTHVQHVQQVWHRFLDFAFACVGLAADAEHRQRPTEQRTDDQSADRPQFQSRWNDQQHGSEDDQREHHVDVTRGGQVFDRMWRVISGGEQILAGLLAPLGRFGQQGGQRRVEKRTELAIRIVDAGNVFRQHTRHRVCLAAREDATMFEQPPVFPRCNGVSAQNR